MKINPVNYILNEFSYHYYLSLLPLTCISQNSPPDLFTTHQYELTVAVLVNLCLGNKAGARLLHERRKEGVVDSEHSALTGDEDAPYCTPIHANDLSSAHN